MARSRSSLVPDDEQITITIGPAEVWCFGGTRAEPGIGPLAQVVVTEPAAKAVVEDHQLRGGHAYLEVRFSAGRKRRAT